MTAAEASSSSASNLQSEDYYEILGVPQTAKAAVIKKAYRKLAVQWHPDKNAGANADVATRNFQKISEAYAVLSDPKQRTLYDQYGKDAADHHSDPMSSDHREGPRNNNGGRQHYSFPEAAGGGMPGGGVSFSFGGGSGGDGSGGGGGGMSPEQAQFLFSQFFGGGGGCMNGGSSSTSDPFGGMMGGDMNEGGHQRSRRGGGRSMPFGDLSNGMHNMHMGGGPDSFGMNKRRRTSPSSSHYQKQKQYQTIPMGTIVTLQGLISKPERNGDRGQIVQYDSNTGRYIIQIENTNETMKVKPTNLFQHDVLVTIHGLVNNAEWNGTKARVLMYKKQKERYTVYHTETKKVMSLKSSNIILTNGTVGKITGVKSKPELNDQWGTIKQFDTKSGRYDVQLSTDTIVRLKLNNVRL